MSKKSIGPNPPRRAVDEKGGLNLQRCGPIGKTGNNQKKNKSTVQKRLGMVGAPKNWAPGGRQSESGVAFGGFFLTFKKKRKKNQVFQDCTSQSFP